MVDCAERSPISSRCMFASEKLGLASSRNGRLFNGALYGFPMNQSINFLVQMGRYTAGEELGKNFTQGIIFQQSRLSTEGE